MPKVRIGAGRMALLSMEDTVAASAGPVAVVVTGARQMLAAVNGEPTADERRAWRMLTTAERVSAMAAAKRSVPGGIEVTWTEGVATGGPVHVGWRTWRQ